LVDVTKINTTKPKKKKKKKKKKKNKTKPKHKTQKKKKKKKHTKQQTNKGGEEVWGEDTRGRGGQKEARRKM